MEGGSCQGFRLPLAESSRSPARDNAPLLPGSGHGRSLSESLAGLARELVGVPMRRAMQVRRLASHAVRDSKIWPPNVV